MDKKKTSPLTIAIYVLGVIAILYVAAALGAAFDLNLNEDGSVNFNGVMNSFETVIMDVNTVIKAAFNEASYGGKFVYITGFAIGIYAMLKYFGKKRLHRKGVEHGSARWGTEAEARKLADKPPKPKKGEPKKTKAELEKEDNNIILSQEVRMSLNTRQHRENLNVLVIGGSGSGKSRFYVKPNLLQMNTSYVVTDPKGELLRSCGRLLEKNGYKVRVFNLIDMSHSHNYNPFNYIYDVKTDEKGNETRFVNKTAVIKMINVLMMNTKQEGATGGDQFWDDATKALLTAISFYLLESPQIEPEQQNFATVMQFLKLAEVDENDSKAKSKLDLLMDELELQNPRAMAVSYYKDFKKAAGETAKSILISCAVRLQAFNLPAVADLTHTDTISLEKTGDVKTAIFILISSSDTTFNFLAAMMYTQLFDSLYDRANFKYGGRLPVHVRCLLDEFANGVTRSVLKRCGT